MISRITVLLFLCSSALFSQNSPVTGKVLDAQNNPISFVTVLVYEKDNDQPKKGVTTADDGSFIFNNLEADEYRFTFSFVGFTTVEKTLDISSEKNLGTIKLQESAEALEGVTVTAKKPTISREAGKIVFNVENTSLSTGSTFDLLKKAPGVVVIGESIQVKFSAPVIYINGKRVYLTNAEIISLLENTDAAAVKDIEIITNPSAKYDGATGTVLNINTSRAIAIGYKGSVNTAYEIGVFPKYRLGTSHFYKNDWLNFYGSYGYRTYKNFKENENFIRYFEPNGSTNSIWNSDFNKVTRGDSHQANLIADFTINKKQTLSLATTYTTSPNVTFDNNGFTEIRNPQRTIDSTFTTISDLKSKTHSLSVNADYSIKLDADNSNVNVAFNYTDYNNGRLQNVATMYNDPTGNLLRNNSFFTNANQGTNIFTGQADLTHNFWKGNFEAGLKYSHIDSNSKLNFFDTDMGTRDFNQTLSDDFNYVEKVYATYINLQQDFDKFSLNGGIRNEYTDIAGRSRSLGETNTNDYSKLFPRISGQYNFNEKNSAGFGYTKSISRPDFQNLNPFRYFINENNFNQGNPQLVPAISDKISINYVYNNVWTFEAFYETVDNALSQLTFQNNENRTIRNSDANLINDLQYSFDVSYTPKNLPDWLYGYITTSTYYLESELFSVESIPETYTNHTAGFFAQIYGSFTISKNRSWTADLYSNYTSNLIHGSTKFKNIYYLSLSLKKSFWDNAASITVGVDDVFNTYSNFRQTSNYYNQENYFIAQEESRLFKVGFKYNFGNARLRDNNRAKTTDETERL